MRAAIGMGLWAAALGAAWALPQPEWSLPDFPRRVVFTPSFPTGSVVLVNAPREGVRANSGFAARTRAGQPLPWRLVAADERQAVVAVTVAAAEDRQPHLLYYGGPPAAGDPALRDQRPVLAQVYAGRGKGVPDTWERLAYLMHTAGTPTRVFLRERFAAASLSPWQIDWRGDGRRPPAATLVWQQSFFLCPTSGVLRLALDCEDAGFVRLDGELALEHPGEHPAGVWRVGPPLLLRAGVHRLEVFHYSRQPQVLRLGWRREADAEVTPLPEHWLLAGQEAKELRVERSDRTLQPGFVYELQRPYAFRGLEPVFVPVRFRNTSLNWLGAPLTSRWLFDDGSVSEEERPRHTLQGLREHRVRLELRDELGFVAACERTLDCRFLLPTWHTADARLVDLPAICYEDDPIAAALTVAGEAPEALTLAAEWDVHDLTGSRRHTQAPLTLAGVRLNVPLLNAPAGALRRLDWRLTHRGVAIVSGVVRFLRAPFDPLPARVAGDRLYSAAGEQLVLVLNREGAATGQPPITTEQAFGVVLCADDTLAAPDVRGGAVVSDYADWLARFVDGPDRPIVRRLFPPPWESYPEAYGPLLKLCQIPEALVAPADVLVLSLGRQDLAHGVSEAEFERYAAALSDLAATLKRPVVWVTPPPYAAEGGRPRAYAAAIRRVAAARNMPVADLFTAFSGYERREALFAREGDPVLTPEAQRLAGQVLARALLSD